MILTIFLIQISLIHSFSINETSNKIKTILKNYRYRRNVTFNQNITSYVENTLEFLERTERFGDFLKYYNGNGCLRDGDDGENARVYVKRHILEGLLINHNVPDTHWHEYKSVYNKVYTTPRQEMTALAVWRENLRRVAFHNQLYLAGKHTYSLHLNSFGDLNSRVFVSKFLKLIDTVPLFDPAEDHLRTTYRRTLHHTLPKRVDWRAKGFKPLREQQHECGACYAFAITHALQAQLYKKHRDWKELSPQQIVDCSHVDGNMGCDGGSLRATLRYVSRVGLISESLYPYIGKKDHCHYNKLQVTARPRRWATLPKGDEHAMERALATIGPLAVAVNASPITFQLYRGGIYDDPFCVPWMLNHAMLLVGYTPQYWILLNWWGSRWGEDGYIRIRRGFNICGVANMATYVEI